MAVVVVQEYISSDGIIVCIARCVSKVKALGVLSWRYDINYPKASEVIAVVIFYKKRLDGVG